MTATDAHMTGAGAGAARRRVPWMAAALTGWAANRLDGATRCDACRDELTACDGCGSPRCLACDPYTSDDCRWAL